MERPAPATLHDPSRELDACGIGFVADALGRRSRAVLDAALAGLEHVAHRGAVAADGVSGDGAGVLLPLPAALVEAGLGVAVVFVRDEGAWVGIEAACRAEGLVPVRREPVDVDPAALGPGARETMPAVERLVVAAAPGLDQEVAAWRARRRAARVEGASVVSLSFGTQTLKALCSAPQLAAFYPELRDPAATAAWAIFHQRFSTNTRPAWERVQPFGLLCHNGEINTIEGNARSLAAREPALNLEPELLPLLDPASSDSAMLDEALQLLVRSGRDVREALSLLVPPAWQHDPRVDDELRALHRWHAALAEPWDGPAGIVFTDGRVVGAALDRNGLRPLRWAVCEDGLVACASEAGAIPLPEGVRVQRGRLGPGQALAVDPERGVELDGELRRRIAVARPFSAWVEAAVSVGSRGEPGPVPDGDLVRRQARAGFTREELSLILRPIAQTGHEPASSMGDDTALPPLAGRARPLSSYLRQRFAQVTNPPIDHLRERAFMSLATLVGRRPPLLGDGPGDAQLVELPGPVIHESALGDLVPAVLDATFDAAQGLEAALARLARDAESAVRRGAGVVVVSDARSERAAVPAALAVGAVHGRLVEAGLRHDCGIAVRHDEPRSTHDVACLLALGADAVCPALALETVAATAAADRIGGDRPDPAEAQHRLVAALEEGVLKVMAKLGIADVQSYRGAALLEALGLSGEVCERWLCGIPSRVGGLGLAELEAEALARHAAAALENPGWIKWRAGGEPHASSGPVVEALKEASEAAHALRTATRKGSSDLYDRFAALVNGREPLAPRDLLELVPAGPSVPLEEVEPAAELVRRFSGGAMSFGALSAEAHETVARALNLLGARSNCGEGGEDPARYRDERNSAIKQVASARFGVTPEYLAFADELQIKIAQGSKPGEGGQIPAHKVTDEVARLRHTQPGVELISPPPHHDIYSIEDLAQLVFDLRQANPEALVSVKLVAETGVGVVAAGVAKTLADVIHVGGADGGTGASPLSSIKHAGAPWELGLAETQQALVGEGLRGRVRLRVDGGLKTGRDVVVAALLGADEMSFGTALLVAEGCLLVRSCHLDTCPVGIATQRPELRAKYAGTAEAVAAYLLFVAEEARRLLASLGLRSLDEAVGRVELLRQRVTGDPRADAFDLAPLLAAPAGPTRRHAGEPVPRATGGELGGRLAEEAVAVAGEARLVEPAYAVTTRDRAVGARLGVLLAREHGAHPPTGRVRARFEGSAGQSFGAFLTAGVELDLEGEANDGVGKGMGGGRIAIRPPAGDAGAPCLVGNAALYGATGGELFCAGSAGERFAVRNSGATAVVEGVGDHACEYMTGGTVVVLGPHGRNLGAGMTGGEVFLLDVDERLLAVGARDVGAVSTADGERLRRLLERHVRATGSEAAAALLQDWATALARLVVAAPGRAVSVPIGIESELSA